MGSISCRRVAAVSADGLTVTLDSALTYTHVRVTETYGSTTVDMAGEVGLLSHNVRFRGYGDPEWVTNITKCEAGFDTGLLVVYLVAFILSIILLLPFT